MADAPIDELKIEIDAEAEKADEAIDNLISRIDNLARSLSSVNGKGTTGAIDDVKKATDGAVKVATNLASKYKDVGKDYKFFGNTQAVMKKIDSLSNALETARIKKETLEASGDIGGKMYESAIKGVTILQNKIESLKRQMEEISETEISPQLEEAIQREESKNSTYESKTETPKTFTVSAKSWGYDQSVIDFVENYSTKAEKAVNSLRENLKKLVVPEIKEENLRKLESALDRSDQKLEKLRTKLANGLTMGTIKESAEDNGFVRLQTEIALTEKEIEALKEKIAEVKKMQGGQKTDWLSGISNGAKKAVSWFKKLDKKIKSITRSGKNSNSTFSSGLKKILQYGLGIRSVYVLFNKLRSAVKDGMKNLVQYSSETNASVSLLTNSLTQAKNASAAMVSPLLNALAPALNNIIQMFVNAANSVNQLLSALTGKTTWIKAKTLTDSYADSLNSAKKTADNFLASFDEINKRNKDTDSSGSGTSAGDMFETVEIESNFKNMADSIKKMWEDADFSELGETIGSKLYNALDKIEWGSIKEKASKIGASIGTLINGFVEVPSLGYKLGESIGEAINTALSLANGFLDNTHWDSIGKFLGEGANGVVASVDFDDIGHMFAQKWNAILETSESAFATFDWENLGAKLSELIATFIKDLDVTNIGGIISEKLKGVLDLIIGFVEKTDWKDLGATVYQKIKDFIISIDWTGIADRLFEAIGAVLGGLAAFVWGIIEEAWNDVVDWWKDAAYEDGEFTMSGLLEGILEALKNIGSWIKEHIFQPFIDGFKKAFGIHSPSTVMREQGGFVISGLLEGLKNKITAVWTWLATVPRKMVNYFSKTPSEFSSIGKNLVSGLWNGMKSMWSSLTRWLSNAVSNVTRTVRSVLKIHSPSKVMFELGGYTIEGFKEGMENMYSPTLKSIEDFSYDVQISPPKVQSLNYEKIQFGAKARNAENQTMEAFKRAVMEGMAEVISAMSVSGTSESQDTIEIPVYIGNEEIARATSKGISSLKRRGVILPEFA